MRRGILAGLTVLFLAIGAPAFACGGLVAPNGSAQLDKTTTLAAYHDGIEHYITGFEFRSAEPRFGAIVPLPGVPTDVKKAGRWTLQRLVEEVQPPLPEAAFALDAAGQSASRVTVIERYQVGALDITVLEGGGTDVFEWGRDQGFALPPDTPDLLEFYSSRSPIFSAVSFNAERAERQGLVQGDSTPIHFTIPTDNPWIPLRILALGKASEEVVKADLFMLTDRQPATLPYAGTSFLGADLPLSLSRSEPASETLLQDLSRDRGMGWLPTSDMWFSYIELKVPAGDLRWDLAVDASGQGQPSLVDAGFSVPGVAFPSASATAVWVAIGILGLFTIVALIEQRRVRTSS